MDNKYILILVFIMAPFVRAASSDEAALDPAVRERMEYIETVFIGKYLNNEFSFVYDIDIEPFTREKAFLHLAVLTDDINLVKMLVTFFHMKTDAVCSGFTPLDITLFLKNELMKRTLLSLGALLTNRFNPGESVSPFVKPATRADVLALLGFNKDRFIAAYTSRRPKIDEYFSRNPYLPLHAPMSDQWFPKKIETDYTL